MSKTVIEHVLFRLKQIGISDVFGVPGDYAFSINDAVCADKDLRWVGNCNELNAAYAADGYARIHGLSAISPTYGVGELSAINGIAGSCAEYLPVFFLVGMPASGVKKARRIVHHTLGNGEFDLFYRMADSVVCARAIMTPDNCIAETERLIAAALHNRSPVYMGIPSDYANMPVVEQKSKVRAPKSEPKALENAVDAIVKTISKAKSPCILPGIMVSRFGLTKQAADVVNASGLPFATMLVDKSVLDEGHPNYMGMYGGKLINEPVREFVESSDCVLCIGVIPTDFNTGGFTANVDPLHRISIRQHQVVVGSNTYDNVEMKDVLAALSKKLSTTKINRTDVKGPKAHGLGKPVGKPEDKITAEYLYPRWQKMLRPDDILIAETGSASMGLISAEMPKGSTFQNQGLWGSIGWATPAAFGAALSSPKRRTILITGEGSHQLTAQEVGQFGRYGLKPIIFVLNNKGYLIERLLCKDPETYYNDLAEWDYHKLPEALGCKDWFTARVTTCGELDEAIKKAETCGTGSYIEVVTDKYVTPPVLQKMHDNTESLYS